MARNQVETCMFCGSSPCACSKPEPKPRVQRTIKPKPASVSETVIDLPDVMPQRRAPLRATQKIEEEHDDSEEYRRALTVLCRSGLICADDIEKHRDDLNMESTTIRSLIWRKKREEALHGKG